MSGPAATGRVAIPAGREIVPPERRRVTRSPSGLASYTGRPRVRRTSGPRATAPSVCAVGTGGSTHSAPRGGGGGGSGHRSPGNWVSARAWAASLEERASTAEPVVLRLVFDDARQLESVELA